MSDISQIAHADAAKISRKFPVWVMVLAALILVAATTVLGSVALTILLRGS